MVCLINKAQIVINVLLADSSLTSFFYVNTFLAVLALFVSMNSFKDSG